MNLVCLPRTNICGTGKERLILCLHRLTNKPNSRVRTSPVCHPGCNGKRNFNLFRPKTVHYLEALKQQFRYFGPFPAKYKLIAAPMAVHIVLYLTEIIPHRDTTPFSRMTEREVGKRDKKLIGKITKINWMDRPSAKELLEG
ncbi:hypothetical protein PAAG_12403 [Paracoccidioides lutzii Pb01]|uniref:Uncharacterized protein n=1 Tax=Paracoccidioides lutzii (strain ATCC MYA-826 / Pb01) TaxID=502779 RepID=A0A0A2V3H2_PARBA|nr:hypothetical protein PAAG_12403 [Paracoccidioides lutzii Pb01]KGQ00932.1 hypothetical protein PAAG_12403 [Paracoccidioides lutzii Pb01]